MEIFDGYTVQAVSPEGWVALEKDNEKNGEIVRHLYQQYRAGEFSEDEAKQRAREIMQAANRKGLMQSGEISVTSDGMLGGALCNCCADCCFPHLLAERLHAEKLWPLTRYQTRVDAALCTACGRCVRRCPFEAIALHKSDDDPDSASISIDAGLCRGCGVCSTGCRDEAISMVKLDGVDSLFDKLVT